MYVWYNFVVVLVEPRLRILQPFTPATLGSTAVLECHVSAIKSIPPAPKKKILSKIFHELFLME